jgi:hypothetical protein
MKFTTFLLFLVTAGTIFWQCSDMISMLRPSGAGPAVMVVLWLPTLGLVVSGFVAFADLRVAAITGGACLVIILAFYALALFSIKSFSFAHDWSYLVPLSGILASLGLVARHLIKRIQYV